MTLKVGLIVGREWSFPPAFIEEVNKRDEGVTAELVQLGAPRMDQPGEYAVIIDRISHEVPFYRTFLKQAVLQGTTVVNNPFMWTADDKFFGAALATRLGIAHPKTVVLPNKEYIPGIVHEESLRNLQYPLDWQGIADYVGMPCILKDAHGGGWKDVYVCRTLQELIDNYDQSGLLTMVAQEFIHWDHFIRCICLGQEEVLPMKYDPRERKYHVDHAHMSDELGRRVVDDSLKLVRALGYDMDSMEWAVKDGVPYAIDFMNPAPDMDVYSLTPHYFEWVVQHMADMAIRLAKNPRRQELGLGWEALFTATRDVAGDTPAPPPPAVTTSAAASAPASAPTQAPSHGGSTAPDKGPGNGSNATSVQPGTARADAPAVEPGVTGSNAPASSGASARPVEPTEGASKPAAPPEPSQPESGATASATRGALEPEAEEPSGREKIERMDDGAEAAERA
ncbi:MAG TPA: hypothetical protein VNP72_08905 [Longimicrobium sp.]|nr:hypothetical protein [Longimicrobium sp.]